MFDTTLEDRPMPAGLDRTVEWFKAHQRALLLISVAFQLMVLWTMILMRLGPLWSGETILLRVVPVDPRDMFRGDYVILGYEFSRLPPQGVQGLGHLSHTNRDQWAGRTIYVSLVPEGDGRHWRLDHFSVDRPTSGKYPRGRIVNWGRAEFGIESYYVQEGKGIDYEQAIRSRRLSAEVAVTADGQAALRRLHVE
jgi:uncharacterized membrane-anchored protein